jgi:hypothetical protein
MVLLAMEETFCHGRIFQIKPLAEGNPRKCEAFMIFAEALRLLVGRQLEARTQFRRGPAGRESKPPGGNEPTLTTGQLKQMKEKKHEK